MQDQTTLPAPSMQSLRAGYSALVLGASGAIGQAFVTLLQSDPRCAGVPCGVRQCMFRSTRTR